MSRTRHRNTMIRVLAAVLLIPCFRLQSISSALKSDKEKKHALKAQAKQQMEDADIDESSASKRVHWIFIHYHKTGHDITEKIAKLYTQTCGNTLMFGQTDPMFPRLDIKPYIPLLKDDIIVLHAPDMMFNWHEVLQSEKHEYRVVHFVRNPYDMIMSGFLYHTQDPPPLTEGWLHREFNPCERKCGRCDKSHASRLRDNRKPKEVYELLSLVAYADDLLKFYPTINFDVHEFINRTMDECFRMSKKYHLKRAKSYGEIFRSIRNQSFFEGLRMEAIRTIVSGQGGDLLRMGTNSFRETESSEMSKRVFLSDFPPGNLPRFKETVTDIFTFLMAPATEVDKPFWGCMSLEQAVVLSEKAAFIHTAVPTNVTNNDSISRDRGIDHIASSVIASSVIASSSSNNSQTEGFSNTSNYESNSSDNTMESPTDTMESPTDSVADNVSQGDSSSQGSGIGGRERLRALSLADQRRLVQQADCMTSAKAANSEECGDGATGITVHGAAHEQAHVTTDHISSAQRRQYLVQLHDDPLLGPIIDIVSMSLNLTNAWLA